MFSACICWDSAALHPSLRPYSDYEAYKRDTLGETAAEPHCMRYKPIG